MEGKEKSKKVTNNKTTNKNKSQEITPVSPEEKEITWEDVGNNIEELYKLHKENKSVKFPPWIEITNKGPAIIQQELFIYIDENYDILSVKLGNSKGIVLYKYENGVYRLWTESECKAFIKSFMPRRIRKSFYWNEIYNELSTESANTLESELNEDEDIINMKNGIFRISTGKLEPHSPKHKSTIQIPCSYIENASLEEAPHFNKFLDDITGGNADDKSTILEVLGLIITNIAGSRFKKLLVLKGKGNTGKSVLREFAISLVGLENTHTLDIKQMHSQFGLAGIYGKRLVGSGDMKFAKLSEIDRIKELTGNDFVNLEQKFQDSFTAKFRGFLWFNCNDLPAFSGDKGEHVYQRFLIVSCDNVIPEDKRDSELLDKIKSESDIIASVSIQYLIKAKERGYVFTESERTISNRKEYAIKNNSLSLFINECCLLDTGRTPTRLFKEQYRRWCRENGFVAEGRNNIAKMLQEDFHVQKIKSSIDYYNLTIKYD